MNKHIFKHLLSLAAVALMGWSCEADYFNEHELDGWEGNTEITDVKSVEYTLTADDYATISKNSTNKTNAEAAGEEAVAALSAIGKNKYFGSADEAAAYIPPFLSSAFNTYDNGSIVMVTYTTALDIPAEIQQMNAAKEYTLTEDNYKTLWGSETLYEKALTPSTVGKLTEVLPSEELSEGDYMVVTYNYSAEEPKAEEEEPEQPEDPEQPIVPEQPEVKFPGEGKYLIVAISETANYAATPLVADKKYGYPTATEVTISENAIAADETTNALAWTVTAPSTEGEYTIQAPDARYYYLSGTYNSFNVSDAVGTDGYGFTFTPNEDGTFAITNVTMTKSLQYDSNYSSFGCYPDSRGVFVTLFKLTGEVSTSATAATALTSEKMYAYFKWNGTAFEDTEIVAVQPSDYTEMGQKYGNFTNPAQDDYLPKFLAKNYPYAVAGEVAYVGYRCYAGGATSWKVDEYVSDGTVWNKTNYFATKTDQFRKNEGVWAVDRTLELDFTNTSSADTRAFYQYCVNWVYDNKDVAMGAPARDNAGVIISTDIVTIDGAKPAGSYWVSNYGNNEFYTGASAYYGNMDWRPSAVKGGFAAAGMGDLSDDEIVAKLKEHTAEVFAEVLHYVYPTMTPEQYKKVVVKVYAYGPNANYAFSFEVTGEGTFAYIADSITEL